MILVFFFFKKKKMGGGGESGVASATPYDRYGVAGPPPKAWGWPKPPLGQKWGGPGKGVAPATPDFPPFFLFFLKTKKTKKTKN
jgi:hypothetical protein